MYCCLGIPGTKENFPPEKKLAIAKEINTIKPGVH